MMILVALPVFGESTSQDVDVKINLAGCWINLDVSNEYLIAPAGGTTYNVWEPGQTIGGDGHTPRYNLYVKSTGFDIPTGHKSEWNTETPYKDFEFRAEVTSGGVSSQITGYKAFDSLNTDETILSTSNARTTHTDMYYRYNLDNLDVPGQYTMNLTYTASTD